VFESAPSVLAREPLMTKKTKSEKISEDGPDEDVVTGALNAYLDVGRVNQKLRTRDALVSVAADFVRKGMSVSVTEVADAARVSRTTAYRYFPTSEMLLAQATTVIASSIDSKHLVDIAHGPGTPQDKLDGIIAGSDAMTAAHESAFRSLLRFSVEAGNKEKGLPQRPTFRRAWLEGALADLKKDLGPAQFNRLTAVLSLFCGIESFVVLRDICGMKPEEAREVKRWAAQQLLAAALKEAAEPAAPAKAPRKAPG
jgi:AcrR family transcriptional regulator